MEVKLTKNALRSEQVKLSQLERYLPTLQLKKAMLQAEVGFADQEIAQLEAQFSAKREEVDQFASLLTDARASDLLKALHVQEVKKRYENIAGIDIPVFETVIFDQVTFDLFDTPIWFDAATHDLKALITAKSQIDVAEQKKSALEKELQEVSIRVNLFEKIMIPRTSANIKKIRIFLGDQELAAVATSKVAKTKILKKKEQAL